MGVSGWLRPALRIADEWRNEFDDELAWTSFVRTRAIAIAVAIFNIAILLTVDLRHWLQGWNRGQAILTGLHAAMLGVSVVTVAVGFIRRPLGPSALAPWHRLATSAFPVASLLWGAAISINAQLLHHEITAYIVGVFGVAVGFPLAPLRSLVMMGSSFAVFATGIIVLPVGAWTRESHFLNSTAVVLLAWVLSSLLFSSRVTAFLHRKTITRQSEQLDAARIREEKQRLALELLEAQRLESMGLLAGGVAHDFNNLLNAIRTNVSLAISSQPGDPNVRSSLEDVEVAVQRAAELANQMLAYSGRGRFQVKAVDLSGLVSEMARLAAASVPRKCALNLELARDLPAVEADVAQLRQVVLNLITNAAESLQDKTGHVTVRTSRRVCSEAELARGPLPGMPAGNYVTLEVIDDGCGIAPEVQARIFDPFFSTKSSGRGLGMAALLGILRGHRGAIQIESEVGRGTRFTVLLPASDLRPETIPPAVRDDEESPIGGRVLVVDDEELVLRGTRRSLIKAGFDVLAASDGEEGFAAFRSAEPRLDAVVVDLSLPGMDGLQLIRELRALRPDICTVLCSGYDASDLGLQPGKGDAASPDVFLQKPYDTRELIVALRRMLRQKDSVRPLCVR